MTKRKCEHLRSLPPCKRPLREPPPLLFSRDCSTDTVPVRKRRLEPESAPLLQVTLPSPDCDRVLPPGSPPPCKKLRVAVRLEGPDYKCQKDEAFSEYNSFHYWKTPLPAVDFSEIGIEPGEVTTSDTSFVTHVQEEMDS